MQHWYMLPVIGTNYTCFALFCKKGSACILKSVTVLSDVHIPWYNHGSLELNNQDLQLRGPNHPYKKLLDIVGILLFDVIIGLLILALK